MKHLFISMNNLVKICLEVISTAESKDLCFDWEVSTYIIKFKKNGINYELKFVRRFFELISEITLIENFEVISEDSITKEEFKLLEKSYLDREDEIKDLKFKKTFPIIERDNKINQIIN